MNSSQIIVLATPVFLVLIGLEWAMAHAKQRRDAVQPPTQTATQPSLQPNDPPTRRPIYRLNYAINSLTLGMLSQITAVFTRLLRITLYTAVFSSLALVPTPLAQDFWFSPLGWLLALVFYDFCYYWLHRMGHEVAVLWAAHVVHHQSQAYNLSTALRQTSSGALLGWVFFLPLALAGVPPLVFGTVALVDLLYQFWVHTELVGKLGWFDRWFCSPSNHRVHHAVNDGYVDKNYGGILIVWDRLFGSFTEEDDRHPCVYGTRSPLNSWDPLWANMEVYAALAHDSWHAKSWGDKCRVWLKPPGWRPADVAARFPKPAFDMSSLGWYDPQVSCGVAWFSGLNFALLLGASAYFLWHAETTPITACAIWVAALMVSLWAINAAVQGRLTVWEVLMVETAALATAFAGLGVQDWHRGFKPLPMTFALLFVATYARRTSATKTFDVLLMAALGASLAGDCFLMFPGYFIPGLVSFLTAHLFYIARFKQGVGWFPHRGALAFTLMYGTGMFIYLATNGLPVGLRGPVAVYVGVIALMAAQAFGRTFAMRDSDTKLIAAGAVFFMASDSLLAINRFVAPFELAGIDAHFWVLSTYFAAQMLIVRGCLRRGE